MVGVHTTIRKAAKQMNTEIKRRARERERWERERKRERRERERGRERERPANTYCIVSCDWVSE